MTLNDPLAPFPHVQHAALALAILNAKPPDLSAREYILRLRMLHRELSLSEGNASYRDQDDALAYWQSRCTSAETKCATYEAQIADLELANRRLSLANDAVVEQPPKQKGKGQAKRSSVKQTQSNKRKQSSILGLQEQMKEDLELLDGFGSDGLALSSSIWSLYRAQLGSQPDPKVICASLVNVLTHLARIVSATVDLFGHQTDQGRNSAQVCARTFTMVLVGLDRLHSSSTTSKTVSRPVVYASIKMFTTGLKAMADLALQATKTGADASRAAARTTNAVCGIAHLLSAFLGALDSTKLLHHELFEGFSYVLVERAAEQLSHCTFGKRLEATPEAELSALLQQHTSKMQDNGTSARHVESKGLVLLLERMRRMAPSFATSTTAKGHPLSSSQKSCTQDSLTAAQSIDKSAQERLQSTMISCMYTEDNDGTFLEPLRKPLLKFAVPKASSDPDENMEEWFQGQVWRLIGWDILARDWETEQEAFVKRQRQV